MGVMVSTHQCGCRTYRYDNGRVTVDACGLGSDCHRELYHALNGSEPVKDTSKIKGWVIEEVEQSCVSQTADAVMAKLVAGDYVVEDTELRYTCVTCNSELISDKPATQCKSCGGLLTPGESSVTIRTDVTVEFSTSFKTSELEFLKLTGETT